jgi:hypothetical protein
MPDETKVREEEISQVMSWLDEAALPDATLKLLGESAVARKAACPNGDWEQVCCPAWQMLEQAKAPGMSSAVADALKGWGRMCLGAAYYSQGDFQQALDHFDRSYSVFALNSQNKMVALFARGMTYARRGESDGFNRCITGELLDDLERCGIRDCKELHQRVGRYVTQAHTQTTTPGPGANPGADDEKGTPPDLTGAPHNKKRQPRVAVEETGRAGRSQSHRVLWIAVAVAVTVLVLALVVPAIPSSPRGVLAAGFALAVSLGGTYLIVKHLQVTIPARQAAVIEGPGAETSVEWGQTTLYRLPIVQTVKALVPLQPLPYNSPKKKIRLGPDEAVEVELLVHYGVRCVSPRCDAPENAKAVRQAVYDAAGKADPSESALTKKSSKGPLGAEDLTPIWERRLLNDIVMSLNEVLPRRSYANLWQNNGNALVDLENQLQARLDERVSEWGMQIEEVSIIELAKTGPS